MQRLIFIILSLFLLAVLCAMIKLFKERSGFYSLMIMILYVWCGMILGISFLEAPLKFQAPNITLALGLGIGRLVFGALNRIEILFAASLLLVAFSLKVSSKFWALFIVVLVILLLQTLWLLPALDARAEVIVHGGVPKGTSHHIFYVVAEFLKLGLLLTLGIRMHTESLKKIKE